MVECLDAEIFWCPPFQVGCLFWIVKRYVVCYLIRCPAALPQATPSFVYNFQSLLACPTERPAYAFSAAPARFCFLAPVKMIMVTLKRLCLTTKGAQVTCPVHKLVPFLPRYAIFVKPIIVTRLLRVVLPVALGSPMPRALVVWVLLRVSRFLVTLGSC